MRRVVVFPAPLRPTSPMRSPGCIRRAGPSAESNVRAPARTSRSVAVITVTLLSHLSGSFSGHAGLHRRRTGSVAELLIVGEHRRPFLGARGNSLFEVGGEQTNEELPQALGLHVPLQASGVQSTPQCAFGQLESRPRESRYSLGHLIARFQQLVFRNLA